MLTLNHFKLFLKSIKDLLNQKLDNQSTKEGGLLRGSKGKFSEVDAEGGYGYTTGNTISWNGDTTGLVGVQDMLYKVSDAFLTKSDAVGGTFAMSNGMTGTITSDMIKLTDGDSFVIGGYVAVIASVDAFSDQGLSFPETGTYFAFTPNTHVSELAYNSVKQLDLKYIPTGAAGYTPVRGIDYWTESDIATIKGYVDDAILNGRW